MVSVERTLPLSITLRPAAPRDADLLRQWRSEPSVRRFQPLNEPPTAPLRAHPASPRRARRPAAPPTRRSGPLHARPTAERRADVASQRMADLCRGRGEKFQWIVQGDGHPAGWITLVVSSWEHGLAEVGYALSTAYQGRGIMTEALGILLDDTFHHTPPERSRARGGAARSAAE